MGESLDYRAVKYSANEELDEKRLEQVAPRGEFSALDLEIFNPINTGEVFEIEVRDGLDPMLLLKHLRFGRKTRSLVGYDDRPDDFLEWHEESALHQGFRGEVTRRSVLEQGGKSWTIVGLPFDNDLVLVLKDRSVSDASARYFSRRVLAEYSFYAIETSSFQAGSLIDVGDWWIYSSDDFRGLDTLRPRSDDFGRDFVTWLEKANAVTAFVLRNAGKVWKDSTLQGDFDAAVRKLVEISELPHVHHALTENEVAQVLATLDKPGSIASRLLRILTQPKDGEPEALVAALIEAIRARHAWFLSDLGTLNIALE